MKTDNRFERDDLIGICLDFFVAGTDTTASTVSWIIMYLVLNPEVQEKVYKEILEELGKICLPL